MKHIILASLAVASLAMVAGPRPMSAKELTKHSKATVSCESFAALSQAEQLALLNAAVKSGATAGWPGSDTFCMGAAEVQAQLPVNPRKKRHSAVD